MTISSPIYSPVQAVTRSPVQEDTFTEISFGSFSTAFSVDFDLDYVNRREFSTAFDFGFARFEFRKQFNTAFSNAFTNENK